MLSVVVLAFAACGSGSDSGGDDTDSGVNSDEDAGLSGACDLLTDEEVSEALDAEMTHIDEGDPTGCVWESPELREVQELHVVMVLDDEVDACFSFLLSAFGLKGVTALEVEGIGDHAVFSPVTGLGTLSEDDYLLIDVREFGVGEELVDVERGLTSLALARLPTADDSTGNAREALDACDLPAFCENTGSSDACDMLADDGG